MFIGYLVLEKNKGSCITKANIPNLIKYNFKFFFVISIDKMKNHSILNIELILQRSNINKIVTITKLQL